MSRAEVEKTPMLEQFLAIKSQHPGAVLFYRMGDFYEMFYEDAQIASEILGLRLTSRAHGKSAKVPLAGFPYHQLDSYLARMVKASKRVVIVEQVEDPKKAKGLVKRDVVRIVTAGTSPSAVDRDDPSAARIAALVKGAERFGYSWVDLGTGEFSAGQFNFDELPSIVSSIDPVELLIPEGQADVGPPKSGATPPVISKVEDWIWEVSFARQTLLNHFATVGLKGYGIEDAPLAISAAGALLHYIRQNLRAEPAHLTSLSLARSSGRMLIEAVTRRNLELVDSLSGNSAATLFAVIDRAVTLPGRRLLLARLLEPLTDVSLIEDRLDALEELTKTSELRDRLIALMKQAGDVQRHLARLATARGSARDLAAIRETLALMPKFTQLLLTARSKLIESLCGRINPCEELIRLLQAAVNDEPPNAVNEGGMIRDGYNAEIDELRTIRLKGRNWLEEYERALREQTGIPNLKVGYNRVFGYYLEVTKSHQRRVPGEFIRRQTLANAERFTTPTLQDYEQKLLTADERIIELESELFVELATQTLTHSTSLQENARILAELDVLSGLAVVAVENGWIRPKFSGSPRIIIRGGRHPVVEKLLPAGQQFVPNDLEIGGSKPSIHIITGPNMAGKSTFLRQTALIVILAQTGSFVPAETAEIGIVDKLFTRIGALDNLAGGESTFLVEMQETASILNNATAQSLVLFDEVGRGTSTFDGISLAWAIVEYLHETKHLMPRTLFATHYHELVDLENYLKGVTNFNVAVREVGDKVLFLRKIVPGGSSHSYGIHVAQMAGLPPAVVKRAREILASLEENDLIISADSIGNQTQSPAPQRHLAQLSLFDPVESKLSERLQDVNPEGLTPLEALQLVHELKKLMS